MLSAVSRRQHLQLKTCQKLLITHIQPHNTIFSNNCKFQRLCSDTSSPNSSTARQHTFSVNAVSCTTLFASGSCATYILPLVLLATAAVVPILSWIEAKMKSQLPEIISTNTALNDSVLAQCKTLYKPYVPVSFLMNSHVETIYAAKYRKCPAIDYERECLTMEDGGTVALDWQQFSDPSQDFPEDAPVLILFPGLTGGSGDSYVRYAVLNARRVGIRAVVFNSRGTGDSPVTSPQFYSASFTGDTRVVIDHVARKYPRSRLLAAGWSLGANILVRYLGEEGTRTPIVAAVSMCNPFELTISNAALKHGFNNIYDWNLAGSLRRIFKRHEKVWRTAASKFKVDVALNARTIDEFDDAITIHSFGWNSVPEYYAGSSSAYSIPKVTIPLLCIQALNDPIAPAAAIPYDAAAANPNVTLVTTKFGGHLGWVPGTGGLTGHPWTDDVLMEWLPAVLKAIPELEKSEDGTVHKSLAEIQNESPAVEVHAVATVH